MVKPLIYSQNLDSLGDWYHSLDGLGIRVKQREGIYATNQRCKEGAILGYLAIAIEKSKQTCSDTPSVLELFCADGYYAAHARRMGAGRVAGIDLDESALAQANALYSLLYGEDGCFQRSNVFEFAPAEPYDVVLCTGGLYHVSDPVRVLHECYDRFSKRFLVVQSVVTVASEEEDYFVTPAPGWRHGSRFTYRGLHKMLCRTGWKILDSHFNHLEANERLEDRGSGYFLCEKQTRLK